MYTLLLVLALAALAAEPSFKDMKELEAVNGYMLTARITMIWTKPTSS